MYGCSRSGCETTKKLIKHFDSCLKSSSICSICKIVACNNSSSNSNYSFAHSTEFSSPSCDSSIHLFCQKSTPPGIFTNEEISETNNNSEISREANSHYEEISSPKLVDEGMDCFSIIPFQSEHIRNGQAIKSGTS